MPSLRAPPRLLRRLRQNPTTSLLLRPAPLRHVRPFLARSRGLRELPQVRGGFLHSQFGDCFWRRGEQRRRVWGLDGGGALLPRVLLAAVRQREMRRREGVHCLSRGSEAGEEVGERPLQLRKEKVDLFFFRSRKSVFFFLLFHFSFCETRETRIERDAKKASSTPRIERECLASGFSHHSTRRELFESCFCNSLWRVTKTERERERKFSFFLFFFDFSTKLANKLVLFELVNQILFVK